MASLSWDSILEHMFAQTAVSGLSIVLQSSKGSFSYSVDEGGVNFT